MTDDIILDRYWHPLAKDVVDYAKHRKSIHDYKLFCRYQPRSAKQNLPDREKILQFLINRKLIWIDGEIIRLGTGRKLEWLGPQLEQGDEIAWTFIEDTFPDNSYLLKFDDSKNKEIGLAGERFVIEELRSNLNDNRFQKVKHVSLSSDAYGYDIYSPVNFSDERAVFLEVKTTSRPNGKFRLFLSRNEFKVSQKSLEWFIVLVRIINRNLFLEGYFPGSYLKDIMPLDSAPNIARWESASVIVDEDWVLPGLPID